MRGSSVPCPLMPCLQLWNGKGSGYGLARLKWEHLMGPKGWCNADSLADLALDV